MKDDAERARECLARTMEEFGGDARLSCAADIRADVGNEYWDVPIRAMLAFAQQPEGWVLVPEVPPIGWFQKAKQLLGADPVDARTVWSAMLDVAPIPGEE